MRLGLPKPMSERGAQLLEEVLSLPAEERAKFVDRLLSSLDSPSSQRIDQLWAKEAKDRLDAFERGEIKTIQGKEVFDEINQQKRR